MIRKRDEQRPGLASELMKASVVRNKFEQLKLEKKRQSLDKLRAYESLSFMNRKRELIDLQMSIQSSRTEDTRREISASEPDPNNNEEKLPKNRFTRSRSKSLTSRNLPSWFGTKTKDRKMSRTEDTRQGISQRSASEPDPNSNEEKLPKNRFTRSRSKSINSSNLPSWFEKKTKDRKMSVHPSLSPLDSHYLRRHSCARFPLCEKTKTEGVEEEEENVSCSSVREEESVWKLLPPVQLVPLHKQKSKSLKEISKANLELGQKLPDARKVSWNDLSDCRYLRGWKNDYSP